MLRLILKDQAKQEERLNVKSILIILLVIFRCSLLSQGETADAHPALTGFAAESAKRLERAAILQDIDRRISRDFKVPRRLRLRTGFWFDVYTRYSSQETVIHHRNYPWVV